MRVQAFNNPSFLLGLYFLKLTKLLANTVGSTAVLLLWVWVTNVVPVIGVGELAARAHGCVTSLLRFQKCESWGVRAYSVASQVCSKSAADVWQPFSSNWKCVWSTLSINYTFSTRNHVAALFGNDCLGCFDFCHNSGLLCLMTAIHDFVTPNPA